MKRCVIYARVSSDEQAEQGLSVDSQIEACRRKADALGAAVLQVYRDDGRSGRTDARPGFRQAIDHCKATSPDYLVVWSSSRFARSVVDAARYKDALQGLRTRVVYASQDINIWTDEGWLTDSIQQIFDEHTSRTIAKDTKRSMLSAARSGFFMGGRVPYGYRAVPAPDDPRRRRLQVDDDEAAVVRAIFRHSAQGIGAFAIAQLLNDQGFTLKGRPWTKNALLHMLKSEVYMGQLIFGRFDRKRRTARPRDEWVTVDSHPAIVEPGLFDQVQRGLDKRTPVESRAPGNAEHTFAGMMRCGACGAALMLTNGTGRGGKVYYYYACRSDLQGQRCAFKRLPAGKFDAWMLGELLDRVLTEDNVRGVLAKLDGAATDWVKDRAARRNKLVLELRTVEGRRSKLYEVIELQGKDAPGISEIGPRLRELNAQIERLEASLVDIEDEQPPLAGGFDISPAEAAEVMREMVQKCESPQALRAFIGSIVQQITVSGTEVVVEYHPECLIRCEGAMVHSTRNWLPVPSTRRTTERLRLARPFLRAA